MSHNDLHHDNITENPHTAYEQKDVNVKAIAWFGVGLLIVTIVAMVVVWGLLTSLDGRADTTSPSALVVPPEPRLQPNPVDQTAAPEEQLHRTMALQEKLLNSYGWVDKDAGVAHIPINEAMKLTVAKYQ
jgi:hypothetical protein